MANTDQYFKAFKIEKISDISLKELKRRYRILAKKYHPDREGGNAAKFRFVNDAYTYLQKLVKAYETLENKKFFNKRFLYYPNESIYDVDRKRWVKVKGVKINTTV